jgi:hypothetical protein
MIRKGVAAHRLVHQAVRRGELIRRPCEVCGSPKTDAHHRYGYDRPLDVAWLCRIHHFAEHGTPASAIHEAVAELIAAGHSQSEAARQLGISRQRVHQIAHRGERRYGAEAYDRYQARRRNVQRPESAEAAA